MMYTKCVWIYICLRRNNENVYFIFICDATLSLHMTHFNQLIIKMCFNCENLIINPFDFVLTFRIIRSLLNQVGGPSVTIYFRFLRHFRRCGTSLGQHLKDHVRMSLRHSSLSVLTLLATLYARKSPVNFMLFSRRGFDAP